MKKAGKILLMVAILSWGLGGCSSGSGECSYDIDCPGACEFCDTSSHTCKTDSSCTDKTAGRCQSDADCDPINERCVSGQCVPYNPSEEHPPDADGGDGRDGGDQLPDICQNPALDCSVPQIDTEVSQGKDLDHDGWGECCDCDDLNASINPGLKEAVYNCKDDDCDPNTPDDDLDGDGYGSILRGCSPGSDCNDSRADINPNAEEICDNIDNDCDGRIDVDQDGKSVCQQIECADLSGHYYAEANCPPFFTSDKQLDISQDGCNIYFEIVNNDGDPFPCNGTVDPDLNLFLSCFSGVFDISCTARVNLGDVWTIDCTGTGSSCTFVLGQSQNVTPCTHPNDPACVGQECGVVCSTADGEVGCLTSNPGGKPIGYYCNDQVGPVCDNDMCHQGACAAPCRNDSDCAGYAGTTCQAIQYTGCGGSLSLTACLPENPGETRCHRTSHCEPNSGRLCSWRQLPDNVATLCLLPVGSKPTGDGCSNDNECQSNLCVCGYTRCSGGETGKCSEVCSGASDCPSGADCSSVTVPDLNGGDHDISACTWSEGGCSHDADCPPDLPVCTVGVNTEGTALTTYCANHVAGIDSPNPAEECQNWLDCYSGWCLDFENPPYCATVCAADADCPTFDTQEVCSDDSECALGYLCDDGVGRCRRKFLCWAIVFGLPAGGVDAIDMCRPERNQCGHDADCRAGEACKLDYNQEGTDAMNICDVAGPGTGDLGDSCEAGGASDCRTSLCIIEGTGGPGKEFCSRVCQTDDDCIMDGEEPPYVHRCGPITVAVPGGTVTSPACIRK